MGAFLEDLTLCGPDRTVEGYPKDLIDFVARAESRYGEKFNPKAVLPEDIRDCRQRLLSVRRPAPPTNRRLAAVRAFLAFLRGYMIA